jgi:hypothetical protein
VVGFTTGSRGKVQGKTCENRRINNYNNNNNNNQEWLIPVNDGTFLCATVSRMLL